MRYPGLLFVLSLALVPACGNNTTITTPADEVTDSLRATDEGWFVLRPDLRKCAAPLCGGYFVERPNLSRTPCFDGGKRAECYVAALDWSATQYSDGERAKLAAAPVVVRGHLVDGKYAAGSFADLAVTDVWSPAVAPVVAGGYPRFDGTLFRAFDSGIRCIRWPCPTTQQETVNTSKTRTVDGVDLTWTCANDRQTAEAYDALATPTGILVDGIDVFEGGPAGDLPEIVAWNFYLRVVPAAPQQ